MYSHVYWITGSVHNDYIFSMELNIMQIFSFTYSCDNYQRSKIAKNPQKPTLLLCFGHAVSAESELAKRATGNLETFQQCNIDIFIISLYYAKSPISKVQSLKSPARYVADVCFESKSLTTTLNNSRSIN